jgi:hypothetical protein
MRFILSLSGQSKKNPKKAADGTRRFERFPGIFCICKDAGISDLCPKRGKHIQFGVQRINFHARRRHQFQQNRQVMRLGESDPHFYKTCLKVLFGTLMGVKSNRIVVRRVGQYLTLRGPKVAFRFFDPFTGYDFHTSLDHLSQCPTKKDRLQRHADAPLRATVQSDPPDNPPGANREFERPNASSFPYGVKRPANQYQNPEFVPLWQKSRTILFSPVGIDLQCDSLVSEFELFQS